MPLTFPPFQLVADEANFVVLNKSAGLNFHCEDGEPGVVALAEKELGLKLYSVHRLDKMTSGLLLLAKSSSAAAKLSQAFAEKTVTKFYLALSLKKPKKKQGLIKGDMEKARRGSWKLVKSLNNPAVTQFFSYSVDEGLRLFVVKPQTGKTHQIRVALKSIGSPILGDSRYAGDAADRGYLHAYSLGFDLDGRSYTYRSMPDVGSYYLTKEFEIKLMELGELSMLPWPRV